MKNIKSQKGNGLIQIIVGIIGLVIIYCIFSNSYKNYLKEEIIEYNKWVSETNNTMMSNQRLIDSYPIFKGITFQQMLYIPTTNLDNESISSLSKKMSEYETKNETIYNNNNKMVDTVNEIITKHNIMINLFSS